MVHAYARSEMTSLRFLVLFAVPLWMTIWESPASAADSETPETWTYRQGYDPVDAPEHLKELPEPAWGKVNKGLQAGLATPDAVKLNEVATLYFVVRNVSDRSIRLSLPERPTLVNVAPVGSTISYGMNGGGGPLVGWELKAGHQIDFASAPFQALTPGAFGFRDSLKRLQPGPHRLKSRTGAYGDGWVLNADGTRREIKTPKGEWRGTLVPAIRMLDILDEQVEFGVTALPQLTADYELPYVIGQPASVNRGRLEWVDLKNQLTLAFDGSQDEHWLLDYRYNNSVFWGPIPAGRFKELGLLELFTELSREHILTAPHQSQKEERVANLITSEQPLTAIGLDFVSLLDLPDPAVRIPEDYVARTIRDRRVKLTEMGLGKAVEKALDHLTANDPPLPDKSEFRVVDDRKLPDELPVGLWGPENDGLQAAALMPTFISEGKTETVRLFIRNVSDRDVYLAVSERAGYDYATAINIDGKDVPRTRPLVYPMGFASVIIPEYNPGQSTQSPPTATLEKILLRPGAFLELNTPTAISFNLPKNKDRSYRGMSPEKGQSAVTHLNTLPGEVSVTWHLHTGNGAIHTSDLKRRLWPARGAWSGILTTGPQKILLQP